MEIFELLVPFGDNLHLCLGSSVKSRSFDVSLHFVLRN